MSDDLHGLSPTRLSIFLLLRAKSTPLFKLGHHHPHLLLQGHDKPWNQGIKSQTQDFELGSL